MQYESSLILKIADIAFLIVRLLVVFVLWNRFVPVWKCRNSDDGIKYLKRNEVAAVFVILTVIGIGSAFITANIPINILSMIGVIIPFVLIFAKEWTLETIFSMTLFWNIMSMSYFIVISATNHLSDNLMNGIENAKDIQDFMNVRLGFFEFVLYASYAFVCAVAVVPFLKVVKNREKINVQELIFLSVQNIAGIILTFIMRNISLISIKDGAFILTEEEPQLLWQLPLVAVLLYFGELSAVIMWQENNRNRKKSEMYLTEKLEKEAMRRNLEDTQKYYERIRKVRHDMVSHLTNIKGLSEHGYENELTEYISKLDEDIRSVEMAVSTGNPVTDMVVNDRLKKSKETGVTMNVMMTFDDVWGISAYDMGIVTGNLLDNAIRAVSLVEDREKAISFQVKDNQGVVLVLCENAYDPEAPDTAPKNEWHGLGLKNVEDIAGRYDGGMRIDKDKGIFFVTVMMKKR